MAVFQALATMVRGTLAPGGSTQGQASGTSMSDVEREELRQLREEKAARADLAARKEAKRARRAAAADAAAKAEADAVDDAACAADAASATSAPTTCKPQGSHHKRGKPDDDEESDDDGDNADGHGSVAASTSHHGNANDADSGHSGSPTDLDRIACYDAPSALEALVASALLACLMGHVARRTSPRAPEWRSQLKRSQYS